MGRGHPLPRRPGWPRGPLLSLALLVAGGSAGCSLTRTGAKCSSGSECAAAFGPGMICAESQLCEPSAPEPACAEQLPGDLLDNPGKYKGWVLLGSLLRNTGKEGARHDAAEIAVQRVNDFLDRRQEDFPELDGLKFGLVQCDHDGDVDEVARLAGYLTEVLEAPLILGPASSSRADAAFRAVNWNQEGTEETRQALFVSPSATSVALTDLDQQEPGLFWRTAPMDDGQGRLMGSYANEQKMPLAVFYEDTAYGRGLYAELARSAPDYCQDCGIPFAAGSPSTDPLTRALESNDGQAAVSQAATVVFIGSQETHIRLMVREIDDALAGKTLFFSDAAANAETLKDLPSSALDRVLGTRASPPPDSETLRFFESYYQEAYEESPLLHSFTANAYDAVWMLMVGSIWSQLEHGRVSAEGAAAGLQRLSDASFLSLDEELCPKDLSDGRCPELRFDTDDLDEMIQFFAQGASINVTGASGSLDYCSADEELVRELSAFELWSLEETGDPEDPYRLVAALDGPVLREALPPCPID